MPFMTFVAPSVFIMYDAPGVFVAYYVAPAQGVYNRLLLVPIVGGACFQRHQLAAVFNASFCVFQMTYEISRINRIGEEGDLGDAMPTYP